MSGEGQVSPRLKPISWLIGTWESVEAKGQFPTMDSFSYNETLVFGLVGQQPLLEYRGSSSHPISGAPMHKESGWLRVRGENDLSFMIAHNFGLSTVEEGQVQGTKISLKASNIGRMSADSLKTTQTAETTQLERNLSFDPENAQLVQEISMATDKTPDLTLHLRVVYKRKI